VNGFSGEQFATPTRSPCCATFRRKEYNGQQVAVSAADPLNLVGILTPGARLPALTGNRVLYRDGVPIAVWPGAKPASSNRWNRKNSGMPRTPSCGGTSRSPRSLA
jgi:ATP-dependent Lhr-like helicase